MSSREWHVVVRRADETVLEELVFAPNWLTAENIAISDAVEMCGGADDDYEADASEEDV